MSVELPNSHPIWGTFELEETLVWYDEPVLSVGRDDLGNAYLCLSVEDDTTLFIPVSMDRLVSVKTGLLSLRQAMLAPERRYLLVATAGSEIRQLETPDIPEDWYPRRDVFLNLRVETAASFSVERLARLSRAQGRELRAIELDQFGQINRTETSLRQLSDVLREYQELDDALSPPSKDAHGHMLSHEQAFAGMMAASVVFIVAPLQGQTLLGDSFGSAGRIHDVLDAASDDPRFLDFIEGLGKREIAHIRDFFTVLEDTQTGVSLFSARPDGSEPVTSRVALPRVQSGLTVIRQESKLPANDFEFMGHLTAIDHTKVTFGVEGLKGSGKRRGKPPRYSGKIDINLYASRRLEGIPTGHLDTYKFFIREETTTFEFSPGSGEKKKYRLMDYEKRG